MAPGGHSYVRAIDCARAIEPAVGLDRRHLELSVRHFWPFLYEGQKWLLEAIHVFERSTVFDRPNLRSVQWQGFPLRDESQIALTLR